ncbi:MAC/perforin domain-containing protein [Crocosphaera sp. XPORK-15E]|uniref:MAC/perforin domain-containing protein n=1 Tax=Crocosphaera sp. XPORK-15E TaxID=3110247 RepID=UPI002B221220|nr:MAC/perforin domain-containing protein [Crocosphaera sp. XPORK-15E]MEA5536945.1 MAC/perforin domain-containing protein [Crocosphaera sp. XPORK-15E]
MTQALILVEKTDGEKKNFSLNLDATLQDIRQQLTQEGFMSEGDQFLLNNAPVEAKDESTVTLKQLVGDDGSKSLQIGTVESGLETSDKSVDRYNSLNVNQKLALFNNIQIYRGLTASSEKGFTKTFKPCIVAWHNDQLPNFVRPSFVTEVVVDYSFSEVTHSMTVSSIDKASASLDTPYGGGQTSFGYAQKTSTTSKEVTEYLTGKFLVSKFVLDVDLANIQLLQDFEQQILTAVEADQPIDQYANLINILNERGYFVPKRFTLGGAILSTTTTQISEFSQAEDEKTEFSVGFKLAIDGFGGGGDYSHSEGKETSSSSTSKYSNLSLTKIGGSADSSNYYDWAKSLNPAINWDVISYDELYPTIALLSDKRLLRYCLQLMETYNTYETVEDKQTVISIAKYTTQVESILTANGTGIGS